MSNNTVLVASPPVKIHATADVSSAAQIGDGTAIWQQVQVREGAVIGQNCIFGKGVFVDVGVHIGNNVKVQNYVSVFQGVTIEDGVFVGPHTTFTNDLLPRAVNPDGSLKSAHDWTVIETLVCESAAIGANSTILCGVRIGRWAMIGAGSVVTSDVPDYALIVGNPGRLVGFVGPSGERLREVAIHEAWVTTEDPATSEKIEIPKVLWEYTNDDRHF
jgi:acetyltransferase-like isoleucine patch superfamily enzyme